MDSQYVEEFDSFFDVDRMISKGLGGGYIDRPYKVKQLEPSKDGKEVIEKEVL